MPDSKPLAFGQVYSTLGRLERDGLVEVVETRQDGAPQRSVYALTDQRAAPPAGLVHGAHPCGGHQCRGDRPHDVAALRTGTDTAGFLTCQRASHLRRMRELQQQPAGRDPASRLVRAHTLARLDADLRWLDLAAELTRSEQEGGTNP